MTKLIALNDRLVFDTIAALASIRKSTPSGWNVYNGPCCVHMGHARPDTKRRSGLRITSDSVTIVHCFNCGFKTGWKPGDQLSRKLVKYLEWFSVSQQTLNELNMAAWRLHHQARDGQGELLIKEQIQRTHLDFSEKPMPAGARPFSEWFQETSVPVEFSKVVEYLASRGDHLLGMANSDVFWWTDNRKNSMNQRLFIPFRWNDKIVGWTGRAIFPTKNRYYSEEQPNYIFNTQAIRPEHEYVFVVEGPLDALSIGGVSTMGDHISERQCQWLKDTGKKIVVVPDREKGDSALISAAIKNNWYVSFPEWDTYVKDVAEAVKQYGLLFSLWTIVEGMTQGSLNIEIKKKLAFALKKGR